ncbi:M23 family metallopeptidase [Cohnella nanjingensis]|uniref:M23 family metallopeptidase n=1 Tax=Cohnella nanjingensis TaxID=1387779 RepID=A0A7X0RRV6_9BACL|nr:M23 family metallopeptidase [Cohnella nanjingensis]MBB6672528.1 M23 family metallopeptidase [Cohnella nanjingensis]
MQKLPWNARRRGRLLRRLAAAAVACAVLLDATGATAAARPAPAKEPATPYTARRELYDRISDATGLAWYDLAAIDQYERTLSRAHPKTRPLRENAVSGVYIPPEQWAGPLNPDADDTHPLSIRVFQGIGRDGSGDGKADRTNDADLLYAVARRVLTQGSSREDFSIGVWEYYQNTRAVQRIQQFSKLYATFGKLDLVQHVFPLPIGTVYAYRSTWGNRRGWGGARIHEGTDIFAGHGVPVRSTCFGVVEIKGWNRYGGWRIGIRDLDNLYHYYAHLSGFEKKIKPGDVVRPGQVIGWVGSSGYGKPGTQGKFPPHLHYGVYRDRGLVEWAFDPYPLLSRWERDELKALKVHK